MAIYSNLSFDNGQISDFASLGLFSLFNGISTFVGYFTQKLFSEKNSSDTI